jgi:hypothetical protein
MDHLGLIADNGEWDSVIGLQLSTFELPAADSAAIAIGVLECIAKGLGDDDATRTILVGRTTEGIQDR